MPKEELPQNPEKKKHPGGRPKENLETLPDNWQDEVLKIYSEGGSDVAVKAWIYRAKGTFSEELWVRWMLELPEFSKTIKRGRLLSQDWWEEQARTNLVSYHKGPQMNAALWYMNMKNRFGWRDKQEVEHTGSVTNVNVSDKKAIEYLEKNPQLKDHFRNIARSLKNGS